MQRLAIPSIALVAGIAFAACDGSDADAPPAADGGTSVPDSSSGTNDGGSSSDADGATASDAAEEDATTCVAPTSAPRVLFLNKEGGVYSAGPDDSRTNVSMVLDTANTVNAWSVSSQTWTTIVDCVKQKLLPFNVTVTDVDPGTVQHVEIVFAQNTPTIFAGGAKSVGPLTCSVKENAVAFVSQPHAEAAVGNGCAAAAQLYGYAMGLEQVTTCPDAMTYDYTACTTAGFTKTAITCGATSSMTCACGGGTTQTSFDKMLAVLGPRCL